MKVTFEITPEVLADLFITAIESGDPVTCAAKGGWCDGIYWQTRWAEPPTGEPIAARTPEGERIKQWDERLRATGCTPIFDPWYADPSLYERDDFQVEIFEVENEVTGQSTGHIVTKSNLEAGLKTMLEKNAGEFANIISGNFDAATADLFLQYTLFGEEKYA